MTELAIQNERRTRLGFGTHAMKEMKVCSSCGTVSCANQIKCRVCGTALPKETLYELYKSRHKQCGNCHAIVSSDASFCPACGRKLPTETKTT